MVRGPSYRITGEYSFQAEWLKELETDRFDYIYLCGLEVEEPTGLALVQSVSQLEGQVILHQGHADS